MNEQPRIAVIGGTGALGAALAIRFARSGFRVVIGSRMADRAARAAAEFSAEAASDIAGMSNEDAAKDADIVILTVPFASQLDTLKSIAAELKDKILVDTTVPLVPPKVARVQLPKTGSAAMMAAQMLGPGAKVVSAFHNVSAQKLRKHGSPGSDVLVFGDEADARDTVVGLVGKIGLRGIHGGPLANSAAAEAMTSVLISINRRYKIADGAGLRITGMGENSTEEQ